MIRGAVNFIVASIVMLANNDRTFVIALVFLVVFNIVASMVNKYNETFK